ncbi:hypothetical protein G7083_14160 (plasmid) [Vibrio sp. HDW18]|uniref:hypothetical protein n=1 Tax=Vibrio sp. HDW18 TaxID=2714948 RepID=UPI00140D14ED|nr:hypothetical protein [Vibrio sp. HDW18]QIL87011.1 hypothetical protein G7083_14160 [Vibrio sp. HDW18]
MAQLMQIGPLAAPTSKDSKTYAVNFKGLMAHLVNILFLANAPRYYQADELSAHLQKDLGLYR